MQKSAKSRILGVNITVYALHACTLSTAEVQIFQQKSLDTLSMLAVVLVTLSTAGFYNTCHPDVGILPGSDKRKQEP